ncbi:hypothetical protein [Nocardia terpenica]|uniref:Uncharacterized protein n=1 Tax=Nocardia terpenica TaxID=455432 RepID=A0A6G9Z4R5_9NOCA|nr:hypothetical protein [Nocardia terpenica]QIS20595.1 hypothetical protein F6W96_22160 [Nocardia terpenica]
MPDGVDRLMMVRGALLQWLYTELLTGRRESTPSPAAISRGWSEPPPSRDELAVAARWLADKGYATAVKPWSPGASRMRITAAGEHVARLPGGLEEAEQPAPVAPTSSTTFHFPHSHDVIITQNSDAARVSDTRSSGAPAETTATSKRRHRSVLIATWVGSIAGIVGAVVALLVWAPWRGHPTGNRADPPTTPPFTWTVDRRLDNCASFLFRQTIDELGPPPASGDWSKWIQANHGIDASPIGPLGRASRVTLTLAGLSRSPVTLTELSVEAVDRKAGGVAGTYIEGQCGGETTGRLVEVNLDNKPPKIVSSADDPNALWGGGMRTKVIKFPYTITDTDTETFLIIGETGNYTAWRIHVRWSDGKQSGDAVIDDHGAPFETSPPGPGSRKYLAADSKWQPAP